MIRALSVALVCLGCTAPVVGKADLLGPEDERLGTVRFDGQHFYAAGEVRIQAGLFEKGTGVPLVPVQNLEAGAVLIARVKPRESRSLEAGEAVPAEWAVLFLPGEAAELGIDFE